MSNQAFHTRLIKEHSGMPARVLEISTPHGQIITPAFMPVGTKAVVSFMSPADLQSAGTQIILGGNTYHMLCSPGMDAIQSIGGMHTMMDWNRPMLTDSGGYQVFSLSKKSDICTIDDQAATFRTPDTGKIIRMTPEVSIDAQKVIGADIIMAFDHCTHDSQNRAVVEAAMNRTHRWLLACIEHHKKNPCSVYGLHQALFGIIQGVGFRDLREYSTNFVVSQDLDGIAFGGVHTGNEMDKTSEVLEWIMPLIPKNKPRYTMGVGAHPQNLLDVIAIGIDMFDCVAPTRNARHGGIFSGELVRKDGWVSFESSYKSGRINIKNQVHATDDNPIMSSCKCVTCLKYSRAHLRFLFKNNPVEYFNLASIHNVQVMHDTCTAARECIMEGQPSPLLHPSSINHNAILQNSIP